MISTGKGTNVKKQVHFASARPASKELGFGWCYHCNEMSSWTASSSETGGQPNHRCGREVSNWSHGLAAYVEHRKTLNMLDAVTKVRELALRWHGAVADHGAETLGRLGVEVGDVHALEAAIAGELGLT